MFPTDHDHREYADQHDLDSARHDLEMAVQGLWERLWSLERELAQARTEVTDLRARVDVLADEQASVDRSLRSLEELHS
jgi:hypothetical protein